MFSLSRVSDDMSSCS